MVGATSYKYKARHILLLVDPAGKTQSFHIGTDGRFQGGYITRTHAAEMFWVQLELSRGPFLSNREKREGVLAALAEWTDSI